MVNDMEHLVICLISVFLSLGLVMSLHEFSIQLLIILLMVCRSCLYIKEFRPLRFKQFFFFLLTFAFCILHFIMVVPAKLEILLCFLPSSLPPSLLPFLLSFFLSLLFFLYQNESSIFFCGYQILCNTLKRSFSLTLFNNFPFKFEFYYFMVKSSK